MQSLEAGRGRCAATLWRAGLVLAFGSTLVGCGTAGPTLLRVVSSASSPADKQAELTRRIDGMLAERQDPAAPGLSIIILKDGAVVYQRSKGIADRARHASISDQTVFELASLTKPITAIAIMQLHERKLLSLQDPLGKWLPQLPPAWAGITVHQLLSHQSGIPEFIGVHYLEQSRYIDGMTNQGLFERFALDGALKFLPGTDTKYSNSNYVVLAEIVARVSGRSYAQYLQENIFAPLGMQATYVSGQVAPQPGSEAISFARDAKPFGLSFMTPGPLGVHSSAADFALLLRALASGTLLSRQSMEAMTAPQSAHPINALSEYYGYGWYVRPKGLPLAVFAHKGTLDGFRHLTRSNYQRGISYVILSNGGQTTDDLVDRLSGIVQYVYE
ncbi:serine hydrolase domain-containing protein [Massilia sp. TWP1-3-3]|uniref:serine hydrolase domain-containing protein n=1 Tax=Massilia sp. TWP1-3-3 TaxID=2804573 RepID=UPI003CE8DE18